MFLLFSLGILTVCLFCTLIYQSEIGLKFSSSVVSLPFSLLWWNSLATYQVHISLFGDSSRLRLLLKVYHGVTGNATHSLTALGKLFTTCWREISSDTTDNVKIQSFPNMWMFTGLGNVSYTAYTNSSSSIFPILSRTPADLRPSFC